MNKYPPERILWKQIGAHITRSTIQGGEYQLTRLDGCEMVAWRNRGDEWGYALYDPSGSLYGDGTYHLDLTVGTAASQLLQQVLIWAQGSRK